MTNNERSIVWFREDLRTDDNPALRRAADRGTPVICLFILDDDAPGEFKYGGASRWWLHHALDSLSEKLDSAGSRLILRRGKAENILPEVIENSGADRVYWNRRYAPHHLEADKSLKESLEDDVEVITCNGSLLFEPWEIRNKSGDPYRVFTPFWKTLQKQGQPREPLPAVQKLQAPGELPASDDLDDWGLLPKQPDWAKHFPDTWAPGQDGAKQRLRDFLDELIDAYPDDRDRPDIDGTSRLSPHLHFGEISPNQVWYATKHREHEGKISNKGAQKFLSELAWREFSYSLIYYNPSMLEKELQEKFRDFPWQTSRKRLEAWQKGETGYPMVDAGMRQLWKTGWMHNRVRMIVGSFLVKHLLLDWRDGMHWFWDTLVDADIGNNTASWQWIAGCGADAAPYFRIFNPMTQGEKFDPNGDYVREFVPELKKLPKKHIHTPWQAPEEVLSEAGVELGKTYPRPIVDHKSAREEALAAYDEIK